MQIGNKKFKELEQKLLDAGFKDCLKTELNDTSRRKSTDNVKINLRKAAETLGWAYQNFYLLIKKRGQMPIKKHDLIIEKLKELND